MPIEIKMSDRFPFSLPAEQRRQQRLNGLDSKPEYDRLRLSVEVDGNNDIRIWQKVFDDIAVAQGGRIFFDTYGESIVRPLPEYGQGSITIPGPFHFLRRELAYSLKNFRWSAHAFIYSGVCG